MQTTQCSEATQFTMQISNLFRFLKFQWYREHISNNLVIDYGVLFFVTWHFKCVCVRGSKSELWISRSQSLAAKLNYQGEWSLESRVGKTFIPISWCRFFWRLDCCLMIAVWLDCLEFVLEKVFIRVWHLKNVANQFAQKLGKQVVWGSLHLYVFCVHAEYNLGVHSECNRKLTTSHAWDSQIDSLFHRFELGVVNFSVADSGVSLRGRIDALI